MEQTKFNPVDLRPLLKSRPRASARMGQLCNHLTHPQFHKYLDVCDVQDEHSRGQHGCDPDKSRVSSFIHCKFFLTSKINSGTVRMRTVSVAPRRPNVPNLAQVPAAKFARRIQRAHQLPHQAKGT